MNRKKVIEKRVLQYSALFKVKRFPPNYPNTWEKLTRAQKAHAYRKFVEYSEVLQSTGMYVSRAVKSKKTIERLKEAGFDVKNGIVLIQRMGVLDKVHVNENSVTITRTDGSYRKIVLNSRANAANLKLPTLGSNERLSLNLGAGKNNGFQDITATRRSFATISGSVTIGDVKGQSYFNGNNGVFKICGWIVETPETYESRKTQHYKGVDIAAKMRREFVIGK
jgi:hypothetical protein